MRSELLWSDQIPDRDDQRNSVNDLCFSPDGLRLVVAVGSRVLVYDAKEGDLLHSLRGHKDTVYSVDYARDGKRFASGGADKTVIIWTAKAEGILKYTHNESVQRVAYNPCTAMLASCTAVDFGLWSQEQKSVNKHKVHAKILAASWSNDGQTLALGFIDGKISIRSKEGAEKVSIERSAPVWCLCWSPSLEEDLLAVGCWDQTLSFYQMSGAQHFKDRKLGFNPCSINYFEGGEYIAIGGSDRRATLCTKEGVKLASVCEKPGWVWVVQGRPKHNGIAVGCDNGAIEVHSLKFEVVQSLYKERFAYRENMTDVIVQHLVSEQKVRIKCRDHVQRVAVYKDRLAVQLPQKLHIYELTHHDDNYDLHYRFKEKIPLTHSQGGFGSGDKDPGHHLAVVSKHVVMCHGRRLQLLDFKGHKAREWILESPACYMKVEGGPPGGESLLLGLEDGSVTQVFVNNSFPVELVKLASAITCCDTSLHKKKVAVVDRDSRVLVYDLRTRDVVFQEAGADSVAFNSEVEDMLCYSGGGSLFLKTGDFPVQQQRASGLVVGYAGGKIFSLADTTLTAQDVPQTASMYRYIERGDFAQAYKVACLGATHSEWRTLAMSALQAMRLDVARQALVRGKDTRLVDLVSSIEAQHRQAARDPQARERLEQDAMADVLAYQGMYQEAAKVWARNGDVDKAVAMFADLRQWEDAKVFAASSTTVDIKELVRRQAEWAKEVNDWRAASEMYVSAGEPLKAVHIISDNRRGNWQDMLIEIVRLVPRTATDVLTECGKIFSDADEAPLAKEVYLKLGDFSNLMALYIKKQDWAEAVKLSEEHEGQFDKGVFLPYAQWLTQNDRFDEALDAYRRAGRPDMSLKMMEQLIYNSVVKARFKDAAYYYWLSSREAVRAVTLPQHQWRQEDRQALAKHADYSRRADLYYAFHHIHSFTTDPFTSMQPELLFQVSRFLMNALGAEEAPYAISRVHTLYTLAKQAKSLGAYKLARFAYDRLRQQRVPPNWQDQIELDMLTIQAKPVRDPPELLPVCYRCGSTNPLLNPFTNHFARGDACTNCGHPFVRSFVNFEVLPLVEFTPEDSLTSEEALDLVRTPVGSKRGRESKWKESKMEGADVMNLGGDDADDSMDGGGEPDAAFNRCINRTLEAQEGATRYMMVVADKRALLGLKRDEVFHVPGEAKGLRPRWYKNMMPDIAIAVSQQCGRFFHEEDFEFTVLKEGHCPFSRVADVGDYGSC